MIIPRLDEHTCDKMKKLCQANAVALYQISQESKLPMHRLARLFLVLFEELCDAVDADAIARGWRL